MTLVDDQRSGLAWRHTGPSDGGAILFLHGLGGSRTAWDSVMAPLATAGFHCIAWDMPGYGASAPIEPLTFRAIAGAAVQLLDLLGIDQAHVVGLSFGGQQALHVALEFPHRINRLVLADTSAVFGADGTDVDEWKRLRLDPLDAGVTPAEMAEGVIDAITSSGFAGPERERAIGAFARISPSGLRAAVECLPTHDVRERLEAIGADTLVIVGEHDEETPLPYSEFLAQQIPHARLEIIPGVGHLTPSEAPSAFAHLIANFLSGSGVTLHVAR